MPLALVVCGKLDVVPDEVAEEPSGRETDVVGDVLLVDDTSSVSD